jgi:hypothetical protein
MMSSTCRSCSFSVTIAGPHEGSTINLGRIEMGFRSYRIPHLGLRQSAKRGPCRLAPRLAKQTIAVLAFERQAGRPWNGRDNVDLDCPLPQA